MLQFEHILYMVGVIVLTFMLNRLIRRQLLSLEKLLLILTPIVLLLDPLYWIYELLTYHRFRWETTLPLYICSLFWMLLPIVTYAKKKRFLYDMALSCLSTICYFGGVLGMVFNVHLNHHPFFHFVSQRSLLYHALMIILITLFWSTGYYQPKPRDPFLFFIPLLLLMVPAFVLNRFFQYDYCYFAGGQGTPFEFFSSALGIPLFMLVLYGLIITVIHRILNRCILRQTDQSDAIPYSDI